MYGYDPNNDGCFELHTGTMPESAPIGSCFLAAAQAYSTGLKVDKIDSYNMRFSDHNSFWVKGVGAVEVLENFSSGQPGDACGGQRESSPYYHLTTDTLDKLNLQTGFQITRASLATGAGLAGAVEACFSTTPKLSLTMKNLQPSLSWGAVSGAQRYRVFRVESGTTGQSALCSSDWQVLGETSALAWTDTSAAPTQRYAYRVEGLGASGSCASAPSACVQTPGNVYVPLISH
jgi:hypothetical protein